MNSIDMLLTAMERGRYTGVLAWTICAASMLMSALLVGVSAWWYSAALWEAEELERESPDAFASGGASLVDLSDRPRVFVSRLPTEVTATQLAKTIYRASDAKPVQLLSMQWLRLPGTPGALDRLQMNVVLRGNYIATKELLAELTDRHPNLSLHRLRMSRPSQSLETDASATFTLWTRSSLTEHHFPR